MFYNNQLVSGERPNSRSLLLNLVHFPNACLPLAVVDVAGSSVRAASRSHHNEAEALVCIRMVHEFKEKGLLADQIAIITFYKKQLRRLEAFALEQGVELATVDSVQGREMEATIVLTTSTDLAVGSTDFLDDMLRINVALTRCRQGQFILGNVSSLHHLPTWSSVISWAESRGGVVTSARLWELFDQAKA